MEKILAQRYTHLAGIGFGFKGIEAIACYGGRIKNRRALVEFGCHRAAKLVHTNIRNEYKKTGMKPVFLLSKSADRVWLLQSKIASHAWPALEKSVTTTSSRRRYSLWVYI